ncbi:ABC transporter ATP-binding protein [Leptothoe sp. PORK10 BA2]|uniref:ABC transporter ATP-binding protein n=1 Tax=Leptothoe sp. PORK10 BA2 TaxID=3110254 RepID=UPI002B205CD7|nr:ATP-binding cassette domain-containing protein [Leptothoe sp. PORK10 BA2]MEA5466667.1 ATP-binding cassette domain-containing protein [Leptothoe sp. PORK10 BA2]
MTLLALRDISKDFGIKEILREGSFSIEEGDRVGLIGTNGSGKSTLLKMIAGLEPIDSGEIWKNASSKIVYLPQQPELDEELTVLEQVFADSGDGMALVREYELISARLAEATGDTDQLMAMLSRVSQQIDQANAWELETQAKVVLTKLGIEDFTVKIGTLSGGYRKRVAIATALLSEPDLILMDEPTNHLDALSVEWLQDYLSRYQGALFLITHDRYFLDQVTTRILEIDRGDLYPYSGNYSYYLEKKAAQEDASTSSQKKHAGVLRRELKWLQRGAKARSTKQRARIDRIRDMQNKEFKQAHGNVDITTAGRRIGKKVVELENVTKGYDGRTLIQNFSYLFTPEDRIGIIGPNGAGKSTLMNIITGREQPDSGTVDIGTTIHIGYFDQYSDDVNLNQDQRVIDYLKDVAELVTTADGTVITASKMLERFLFPPDQQYSPIHKLSGGERRRLFLLRVLMQAPNVLILDEPTNDLDVQTLGILEDYLESFNGCVIVVSHDRYFLDRTVETIFAFEGLGKLKQYPGNYSVYLDYKEIAEQEEKLKQEVAAKAQKTQTSKTKTQNSGNSQKVSYKEKREHASLEEKIPQLEAEKETLEKQLYVNPPSDYNEMQALSQRLAQLNTEIETATERWMELAEKLEN